MDLEERIARLIDPEVWETVDYLRVIELPLTAQEMTKSSLIAARRVIDGLGLKVRDLPPEEADSIMKVDDGYEPYIHGDWT